MFSDYRYLYQDCRWKCYGGDNESYIKISDDWAADYLYDFAEEDVEFDDMPGEEILKTLHPESNRDKVHYRLLEMMVKGDLPRGFIILLWW